MSLFANTIIVKQNGTGDYIHIQSAIEASTHNDTVLVYPGTYYENVDYLGKNITLASLAITSGVISYRDSTIIDGHQSGSCVVSDIPTTQARLYGFTIQNGSGKAYTDDYGTLTRGGGIWIDLSQNFQITNCIIKENFGDNGGGILVHESTLYLAGNIIFNNCSLGGGGLSAVSFAHVIFDPVNRCSIFENYAGTGNDISNNYSRYDMEVYLEKGTIYPTNDYYISSVKFPGTAGDFTVIDIWQAHRTEVNQNLFVSPDGNDEADGLSPINPLRTITKALHTIQSDSLNPKTIFVASGTYSTDEGHIYPLSMKRDIHVIGDSINIPIIENKKYNASLSSRRADNLVLSNFKIEYSGHQPYGNFGFSMCKNIKISNIFIDSLVAGLSSAINFSDSDFEIDNIHLKNMSSSWESVLSINSSNGKIKNLYIDHCYSNNAYEGKGIIYGIVDSLLTFENVSISNCYSLDPEFALVSIGSLRNHSSRISLKNVSITNSSSGGDYPIYICAYGDDKISEMTNCTFSKNSGNNYSVALTGNWKIKNTIFDNSSYYQMVVFTDPETPGHAELENCFIKGYPVSIPQLANNYVTLAGEVYTGDPGFISTNWSNPLNYQLHHTSQLINAGTADTTGLFLLEYDLLGNPRIYQDIIDVGAYEWDGTVETETVIHNPSLLSIRNYPNPFNPSTTLSYQLPDSGKIKVNIYNVKGQLVKSIYSGYQEKGTYQMIWDGKDDNNNSVSSGIYYASLKTSKQNIVKKMLLLK